MATFDELEILYEKYNYKQMEKEELYNLVEKLLTDREVFEHFFMYSVARKILKKNE